jgi:D-glycero-D-manno-heptose 1,7-bisphosphate phosphatase
MNKAFFLDRDGVLNTPIWNSEENAWDSPFSLEQFTLLPGVAEAVARIEAMGYLRIVISNQPGAAKGKCSVAYLETTKDRLRADLAAGGASVDGIYYCLHHPQATVPEYLRDCDCRKPKPGMLLQGARDFDIDLAESWMLGDQERDVQAGIAAGCRTVRIDPDPEVQTAATLKARDLLEAVGKVALWLQNPDNALTRGRAG